MDGRIVRRWAAAVTAFASMGAVVVAGGTTPAQAAGCRAVPTYAFALTRQLFGGVQVQPVSSDYWTFLGSIGYGSDTQQVTVGLKDLVAPQLTGSFELSWSNPDGTEVDVEVSGGLVQGEDGSWAFRTDTLWSMNIDGFEYSSDGCWGPWVSSPDAESGFGWNATLNLGFAGDPIAPHVSYGQTAVGDTSGPNWLDWMNISGPAGTYTYARTPGTDEWVPYSYTALDGTKTYTGNHPPSYYKDQNGDDIGDRYGIGVPAPDGVGQIGGYGSLDGSGYGDGTTGSCYHVFCEQ